LPATAILLDSSIRLVKLFVLNQIIRQIFDFV